MFKTTLLLAKFSFAKTVNNEKDEKNRKNTLSLNCLSEVCLRLFKMESVNCQLLNLNQNIYVAEDQRQGETHESTFPFCILNQRL